MGITKQGLAATTALLGACFAGMLALLSLEALDGSRIYAMIGFSAALPLLRKLCKTPPKVWQA